MGGIQPIRNRPAERWAELVGQGMNPDAATAQVRREYHPSLLSRAEDALTTPAPAVPKPMGSVEATLRAAAAAPASVEMASAAKTREATKPSLASTAGTLFINNIPAFLMPQIAAQQDQQALDAAAAAGVDVGAHAGLLGLAAAGGDVTGNVLLNKAIPGTAPLREGMTAPQVVGNLAKAGAVNYGIGAGLTKLTGGTNAEANRAGLIQGGLGTALHGLAGAPAIKQALGFAPGRSIGPSLAGERGALGTSVESPLPPIRDASGTLVENRSVPLADVGTRLYRETNAGGALDFLGGHHRDMSGDSPYFSNTPELAKGQHGNTGVLLELNTNKLNGYVSRDKPTWESLYQQGKVEVVGRLNHQSQYANAVDAVTIQPNASGDKVELLRLKRHVLPQLEARGWSKTVLPDGSIRYGRPQSTVESGTGAVPIMSGITGGVIGGSAGYASGTTPEEKRQRAILGALAGAGAGILGGVAAERIGAKGAAPEPLPPKGNTPAEEYGKLSTFALDPTGEARLRDHLERAGPITRGDPKTVESWNTVRMVAKSLGVEDVIHKDATRLNRNELLAIRDIVHTNIDDIQKAVTRMETDPTISPQERAVLQESIAGMEQQNVHLLDRFTTARGEMGRNLNALKILASRTLDPVVWLSKAQSMRGALGVPDEMRATILRYIKEGNREGLVKTLMDARNSTGWEKASTFWSANLLSNPATHVVNVLSNAALGTMEQAKNAPAAMADRLMSLATDQHTTAGWTHSMMSASKEGARRGFAAAMRTLRGGMDPATMGKYDIPKQTNYANPILQVYTESIFRTLGAEDQVSREMALSASLANQAEVMAKTEGWKGEVRRARVAQLRSAPSDEMVLRAVADAEEATVRDRTNVGKALQAINRFEVQGVPVGKFVVPFTRTPGAVATRIGEYSPAGLAVGTFKTARVLLKGLRDMKVPAEEQRYAAKLFGRGATGTALTALGYYLASKGMATGPGNDGSKDWATASVTGQTPTSVKAGKYWWEIGRINPVGNLLSLGANLYEREQAGASVGSNIASVPMTVVKTVADQPFLLGIQKVLQELHAPKLAIGQFTEGVAAGFIPASALLSAVARGTDPVQRQTPGLKGYLTSRVPTVGSLEGSTSLPPAIDALGAPKERAGGVAEQMFSPSRRSEDQSHDPIVAAMLANDIQVNDLKRQKDETPEAFAARAISEGQQARVMLERLLRTQRWARATKEQRQELFKEAFAQGRLRGAPRR